MLSQPSTYAVSPLGVLANAGQGPARVKHVARACRGPAPYLAKIINTLSHKDLVRTQRGVGGGVVLARPAEEITLYDVCVAMDDELLHPHCLVGHVACTEDRRCPAHGYCRSSRRQLIHFLQRTTIADIAAFETRRQRKTRRVGVKGGPSEL